MPKYRKRPVVIEADQWFRNGDHPYDGPEVGQEGWVVRYFRHPDMDGAARHADLPESNRPECYAQMHDHGWIDTIEGGHTVCPGDWIITGVEGERYPCEPRIFAKTYEAVEELV